MRRLFLALALIAVVAGCSPDTSDRALVEFLQVLAIRADPAEIAPGESATLSALVADPVGAGRTIEYQWGLCTPDPGVGLASCAEAGRTVPLAVGTSATLNPAADLLAALPPEQQELGIDLFAVLAVRGAAVPDGAPESTEISFKRVRVSTRAAKNTNPVIASFTVNGDAGSAPLAITAAQHVELIVRPTAESLETFPAPITGEILTEEMRITWLMTAGLLDDAVSFGAPATGMASTFWEAAPPATLWVVVRDPRGGITWTSRQVTPSP